MDATYLVIFVDFNCILCKILAEISSYEVAAKYFYRMHIIITILLYLGADIN